MAPSPVQTVQVFLRCRPHWGSAASHSPSGPTHRRPSRNRGTPRPRGAGDRWLAFSGGQTWRRFCCGGRRSARYPGPHAPWSEPASDSKNRHFCDGSLRFYCRNLRQKQRIYWQSRKAHAWSSYPSILARMNWSMLYWAKALRRTKHNTLHLHSGPYFRFLDAVFFYSLSCPFPEETIVIKQYSDIWKGKRKIGSCRCKRNPEKRWQLPSTSYHWRLHWTLLEGSASQNLPRCGPGYRKKITLTAC